jgi:uncharacterized protein with PIN domain
MQEAKGEVAMAVTEYGTTYYSSADLTHEAKSAATGHLCPECNRQLRVSSWELAVGASHTPALMVHTRCPRHDYYLTLGHVI